MTPYEYEEIVSQMAREIVKLSEGNKSLDVKFGKTNLWLGASGHCHQIDVSVCNSPDLILIECKHWRKNNVDDGAVLTFFGRVADISPYFYSRISDTGLDSNGQIYSIMATTRRFAKGAKLVAEHFNIQLWSVQSVMDFSLKYKNQFMIRKPDNIITRDSAKVEIVN